MKHHGHIARPLKWAVLAAAAAWALTATENTAADPPDEGVSVQPAVATWTSAVPVRWVSVELLSEFGHEVPPISLSKPSGSRPPATGADASR
ncbi:hypothetical protein [Halomonas heilongjiangensis]|uniref:Uncharacterized protein n=1 Tax=Halomonas heilongjiangensis TaxID=1387883 RepID=A0A2N7TJN6_9GAMM|nr:hypothetical protein [Halomonas heilongjiangensis]PMR68406.1 hypothetical protein C1H66_15285 [Halomonas heilongjiangensis]PXX87181.1 hypothetical protein CR158_19310 [Halomonas heilongjiangensis]